MRIWGWHFFRSLIYSYNPHRGREVMYTMFSAAHEDVCYVIWKLCSDDRLDFFSQHKMAHASGTLCRSADPNPCVPFTNFGAEIVWELRCIALSVCFFNGWFTEGQRVTKILRPPERILIRNGTGTLTNELWLVSNGLSDESNSSYIDTWTNLMKQYL